MRRREADTMLLLIQQSCLLVQMAVSSNITQDTFHRTNLPLLWKTP